MGELRAIVRDLSHKGLGVIDHPDGRVFFCRGTWPGDEGVFEVTPELPSYSEVDLLELLHPSPSRIPSPCPHRGHRPGACGGCPWMIAPYEEQLRYKSKRLIHSLERRKISPGSALRPIIGSEETLGYRNRVQLKTDGEVIGYVSEGSRTLAPVSDCVVMNPRLRGLFQSLRAELPREDLRPGKGHAWNFIDLDDEMTLDALTPNRRRPFRQGNSAQNIVMRNWLQEKTQSLPRHWPVLDLFAGSGNFTEVLSREGFENILAAEVQGVALDSLRKKNLSGVRVHSEDLTSKGSWSRVARLQPHAKLIVVDPAREGILKRRNFLKSFDNLEVLIYISCEMDSFSRDAGDFIRAGLELVELTPLDLFPHTPHVEILSVFKRVSKL